MQLSSFTNQLPPINWSALSNNDLLKVSVSTQGLCLYPGIVSEGGTWTSTPHVKSALIGRPPCPATLNWWLSASFVEPSQVERLTHQRCPPPLLHQWNYLSGRRSRDGSAGSHDDTFQGLHPSSDVCLPSDCLQTFAPEKETASQ